MSAHVTSKDHGANAMIAAAMRLMRGAELKVGVLASGKAGDKEPGGMTVADVATIHEFGAPDANIPERSFIRAWYDDNLEENRAHLRSIEKRALRGEITQEQGLNQFGLLCQASIQTRIANGIAPALKPATIAAKGSSTPLVDTGQLKSSITYEVL